MTKQKDGRKNYDTGLKPQKGTKNIWMKFQSKKVPVDQTTGTDDWDKAQEVITAARAAIADGTWKKNPSDCTWDEAWDMYVERRKKFWCESGKTEANDLSMLKRLMGRQVQRQKGKGALTRPVMYWSGLQCATPNDLTYNLIEQHYTDRFEETSAAMAKAEIEFLRRLVGFLHTIGKKVPSLASIKIPLVNPDNGRKRICTPDELHMICDNMPEHHAEYIMAIALTGSRKMEIAKMQWSNIDWVNGKMVRVWLYDSKNKNDYSKPLVDEQGKYLELGKLLKKRFKNRTTDRDWVFPAPNDPSRHRDHSLEFWYRAVAKTDINSEATLKLKKNNMETLCIHHIRHMVGASLAVQGYNSEVIKKQLNQKDNRSAQTYIDRLDNPFEAQTMGALNGLMKKKGKKKKSKKKQSKKKAKLMVVKNTVEDAA